MFRKPNSKAETIVHRKKISQKSLQIDKAFAQFKEHKLSFALIKYRQQIGDLINDFLKTRDYCNSNCRGGCKFVKLFQIAQKVIKTKEVSNLFTDQY